MAVVIWTEPRTWVDGETPTGGQFNTHIRDNLKFLKETPAFDGTMAVTGDVNASGDVNVGDDATIQSDLHVLGNTALDGHVNLGTDPADVIDVKGTVVGAPLKTYSETRTNPAILGGALTLDCAVGTYFRVTLNSNHTVVILNPPAAGRALGISIIFTADGTVRAITWPPSVVWASNVAPTMTGASGKRDWITLVTDDGGATWFGCIVGQNY
jgi:hypothetical protein